MNVHVGFTLNFEVEHYYSLPLLQGSGLCRLVPVSDDTFDGKLDELHIATVSDRLQLDHCVQGHLQPRQRLLTCLEIIGEQTPWGETIH